MKVLNIKRILAVTFTLTLTAVMLKIATLALNYRYNYNENGDVPYHFYKDNTEYDVLFIGTSRIGCALFPLQLWHEKGITSYNLAISAARIPSSYHIFKNAIQFHRPRIAILDTTETASNSKISYQLDSLHYGLDIIPLSPTKYKSLKDLFPNQKQLTAYLIPFSLFHNRWKETSIDKTWDALFHTPESVSKGAWFSYNVAAPSIYPTTDLSLSANTIGMDYIRAFVSLCREKNIKPILVTFPHPAPEYEQMEENTVTILSKELAVDYYNLNKINLIDWNTDLNDPHSHVNMSGARKVTDYIGKLLVETYGLEDHRDTPNCTSWNNDWEAYKQKLFVIIREKKNFNSALMLCNNSVFTARLFIKDGVELDSVEQKLVAQLGNAITVEHVGAADGTVSDTESTAPGEGIPDLHLEVYDSETGSLICQKQWDNLVTYTKNFKP